MKLAMICLSLALAGSLYAQSTIKREISVGLASLDEIRPVREGALSPAGKFIYLASKGSVTVIDTPAGPFTGPGWTGELLLALSGTAMYSFGLGPHGLPVPLDCALVGVTVHSQAFRVDDVLGEVSLNCVNGLALTIGA